MNTNVSEQRFGRFLRIALTGAVLTLCGGNAFADEDRWDGIRDAMFGSAAIVVDSPLLAMEAPKRAHDASVVPITVKALDPDKVLRKVHLVVDDNPVPLAGTFTFTDAAGAWESLETRIRVNEYTNVRAIAELEDGSLHMTTRFVKAAGGCSAPAMGDLAASVARAGKMKIMIKENEIVKGVESAAASSAVIRISHPNNSGMQFDQISRNYIPAFFVHTIVAEINGEELMNVETNFSLSENPFVRLNFNPQNEKGELKVYSEDSKGNRYEMKTDYVGGSISMQSAEPQQQVSG